GHFVPQRPVPGVYYDLHPVALHPPTSARRHTPATGRGTTNGRRRREEAPMDLVEESPYRFRIDPYGDMRVPGIVFASRALLPDVRAARSREQVANVATLPGIVTDSYAMPDIHWGYGYPIGGVAATDVDAGGVVSP